MPEGVPAEEARETKEEVGKTVYLEVKSQVPRDFYLTTREIEKHRPTRGCGGCSSWFKGLGRQPHNDECRERFREAMKDEAKVKHAKEAREEFARRQEDKKKRKERILYRWSMHGN